MAVVMVAPVAAAPGPVPVPTEGVRYRDGKQQEGTERQADAEMHSGAGARVHSCVGGGPLVIRAGQIAWVSLLGLLFRPRMHGPALRWGGPRG